MPRVLTKNVNLAYVKETALGVADTSGWRNLEPNDISNFGSDITTVERNPISKNRQRRKGIVVDLDSGAEFVEDLTLDATLDFVECFLFVTATNKDLDLSVSAVGTTADDYTVAALSASRADRLEFTAAEFGSLIYARGFANAANNGLKQIDTDIAASATSIPVTDNLIDETPPANARIELAGVRSIAGSNDFTWDWDGTAKTATLTSAGLTIDFTVLGLTVGQICHIGSADGAGGIQNAFQNSVANDMFGLARIKTIAAKSIVFDKVDAALQFDDATAPTTDVDILFSKYARNVATDNSDYLAQSLHFEAEYPTLGSGDTARYEYSKGNFCNQWTWDMPGQEKVTMTAGFVGTDTDNPTSSRKTGADSALDPVATDAFGTTQEFIRLRIQDVDDTALTTDFNTLNLTINNNVSAEKVLGTLGAKFLNCGTFEVGIDATVLFTEEAVPARIRDNTTVTMDFALSNEDAVIAVDIPSMTLGGGGKEFPTDETVRLQTTGQAFEDPILGISLGISFLPPIK
jgi:hypothetical protein